MNPSVTHDENFYQTIIEKYSDMVLRIAFQNTFSKCDAEDIVQEVFIKFLKEVYFNDEEHTKAWFIRVTINQCKDLKKSFWHRKVDSLTEDWKPFSDTQVSVLEELKQLPSKYRNVIYLYYFEGYSIREIADILKMNENTVSSWMRRARKKLKTLILEGGNDYEPKRLQEHNDGDKGNGQLKTTDIVQGQTGIRTNPRLRSK